MDKYYYGLVIVAMSIAPALGQTTQEQALTTRLLNEIRNGVQCDINLIDEQKKNKALEERIKTLEKANAK